MNPFSSVNVASSRHSVARVVVDAIMVVATVVATIDVVVVVGAVVVAALVVVGGGVGIVVGAGVSGLHSSHDFRQFARIETVASSE